MLSSLVQLWFFGGRWRSLAVDPKGWVLDCPVAFPSACTVLLLLHEDPQRSLLTPVHTAVAIPRCLQPGISSVPSRLKPALGSTGTNHDWDWA